MTEQYPSYSYIRISQQLKLIGMGLRRRRCAVSGSRTD